MGLALVLCLNAVSMAQIEITDSHGKYRFEKPPERFVALNWALAEQLMVLGEMPLGVADLESFQDLSANKLSVDDSVHNLGARLTPDLAKVRELKPEIIFIGYSQRPLLRPLSNIATVVYFKNFGHRYDNAAKSKERFLELAKLFNKTALANDILRQRDARIEAVHADLNNAFADVALPDVVLVVPAGKGKRLHGLFGRNSMPYAATSALGVHALTTEKTDKFGVAQLSTTELNSLIKEHQLNTGKPVCVLEFDRYSASSQRELLTLENDECHMTLSYQQGFGGVMSLQWLSESLSHALKNWRNGINIQ